MQGYRLSLMSTSVASERTAKNIGCVDIAGSGTNPKKLKLFVGKTIKTYDHIDGNFNQTEHTPKGLLLGINVYDLKMLMVMSNEGSE
jgi:hypothetical protein